MYCNLLNAMDAQSYIICLLLFLQLCDSSYSSHLIIYVCMFNYLVISCAFKLYTLHETSCNPPVPSLGYLSCEHDACDWLHLFKKPDYHSSCFQLLAVHPTLYTIKSLYPAVGDICSQMT